MYHELLKLGEPVNTNCYRQQMVSLKHALEEKRPEWASRHGKMIWQHDRTLSHTAKAVRDIISAFNWGLLPHPLYQTWPHQIIICFHRCHTHFLCSTSRTKKISENGLTNGSPQKVYILFWEGVNNLPQRWQKCIASDSTYFE